MAAVMAAGSVAVLALAVAHLRRAAHPLVDLRPISLPSFQCVARGGVLFWMVISAVPFLLPLLLQNSFRWSAITSGSVVLTVFAGNITAKPATTILINRVGPRSMLVGASCAVAATTAACMLWTPATPLALILAVTVLSGAARSIGLTAYTAMAYAESTGPMIRHANTLTAIIQQAAMGLGVTVAAVGLKAGATLTHSSPTSPAPFQTTLALLAVMALGSALDALRLPRSAGDTVRTPAPARHRGPTRSRLVGQSINRTPERTPFT